jgi:hypothetical protein
MPQQDEVTPVMRDHSKEKLQRNGTHSSSKGTSERRRCREKTPQRDENHFSKKPLLKRKVSARKRFSEKMLHQNNITPAKRHFSKKTLRQEEASARIRLSVNSLHWDTSHSARRRPQQDNQEASNKIHLKYDPHANTNT